MMLQNMDMTKIHNTIIGQGDFTYRVDAHWGELDPKITPVENCHDLDIDKDGNIYMITDHPKNNIIVYNKDGKMLDAFSSLFPGGHNIKVVEENGETVLYVVDSGWILNRRWDGVSTDDWDSPYNKVVAQSGMIAKLTKDGRLIWSIGHPQTFGAYTPDQPFRPTDIAIASNGDFYVTDGYGSDYVLQFDNQGRFINRFGGHDNIDSNQNLNNTHGIGIDTRNGKSPELLISSRADRCLKRFSLDGTYIDTINTPGAYIGGPVFDGNIFVAPVCWSHVDGKAQDNSGFISVFNEHNQVIANLGGKPPEYIDGNLQTMCSSYDTFMHCHGICIDNEHNLYVGQWRAKGSYPIKLHRMT